MANEAFEDILLFIVTKKKAHFAVFLLNLPVLNKIGTKHRQPKNA